MSTLIAITYPDEATATQVMGELNNLQNGRLIDLIDAVYVTKDQNGKVKLHQTDNMAGMGAISGGFWGMLIGALFFAPFLGLALGAATGALAGRAADTGISDDFMRSLSQKIEPGSAAVFMLVSTVEKDKVREALSKYDGEVFYTNLSAEQEEHLRQLNQKGVTRANI